MLANEIEAKSDLFYDGFFTDPSVAGLIAGRVAGFALSQQSKNLIWTKPSAIAKNGHKSTVPNSSLTID